MTTTTTSLRKKAAAAALVALTLGGGLAATTGAAQARNGHNALAFGALAAVAGVAIAASSAQAHAGTGYYGYDEGYAQPVQYYGRHQPVYEGYGFEPRHHHRHRPWRDRYDGASETGFAYRGPVCKIKRQQVFDGYGWRWQKVQVCR